MPSQFRFHSDRPLEQSLLRVAETLGPKLAATDKLFRTRVAALKLTREQQKALLHLTPGAAVRFVREGKSPSEFFRQATEAGRMLALRNTHADQVVRALAEYEKAAAPVYRSLQPTEASQAKWAKNHLHCALIIVLNQAFASVQEAESAVLYEVLGAELHAANPGALLRAFLRSVARHFGAARGCVYMHDHGSDDSRYECAASLSDSADRSVNLTPQQRKHLNKLSAGNKSHAIEPDWPGSVWTVPVGSAVLQLGFTGVRSMLPRESELLTVLSERCGLALVRRQREALTQQMSVRMLEVEELERRRISRELHDDAAQALAVLRLQLEMSEFATPAESTELKTRLAEMRELTERTIRSVRGLISDLSPAVLEQLGLAAAVRQLANRFQADRDVSVRLHVSKLARMHPRLEVVIYRVLQECFRNIAQHSQAVHINVSLTSSDGIVRLDVQDDGIGFDVDEAFGRRNCYGLVGIRERVTLLGGSFSVKSTYAGNEYSRSPNGTTVMVQLPLTGELP